MRFFLAVLLFAPLFASNLLTYNIYERPDRVDIMLSFDSPYDGAIKQQSQNAVISLLLSDLTIDDDIEKSINSAIVQSIALTQPDDSTTKVELKSTAPMSITASKTADRFGLRIRITKLAQKQAVISPNIKTKGELPNLDNRYFVVVGVLVALFLFLLFVKKITAKRPPVNVSFDTAPKQNSRSDKFKSVNSEQIQIHPSQSAIFSGEGVDVIYQRELDSSNKVMLLGYENRKYLVLVGNSNALLDSFGEEKIRSEQDFEVFFEENKQKLNAYLENRRNNTLNSYKNALEKD